VAGGPYGSKNIILAIELNSHVFERRRFAKPSALPAFSRHRGYF
jgi:hypothetical protein